MPLLRPLHIVAATIGLVVTAMLLLGVNMIDADRPISLSTDATPAPVANLGSTLTPTAIIAPPADDPIRDPVLVPLPTADDTPDVPDFPTASGDWTGPIVDPVDVPLGRAVTHADLDAARTALQQARDAWERADIGDYTLVVREYCRCPDATIEVTVIDGVAGPERSATGLPFTSGDAPQSMLDVLERADALIVAAETAASATGTAVSTDPCMAGSFRLEFSPDGHLRTLSNVDGCDGGATWTVEFAELASQP